MSMLTGKELQAIRVRYQHMVEACPTDRGMLERDRYCRGYAQKDIPAILAHIEAQRDALTAAKEQEKRLVDALEECVPVLESAAEFFNGVSAALNQARAALARVKEEV